MMTIARLSLRIQRFELVSVVIMVALLTAAALVVREHLAALNVLTTCFADLLNNGPLSRSDCVALAASFFAIDSREATPIMQAMAIAPLVAGILLGVGLVSREIETGTAGLAWALAGSRARWLAGRLLPMAMALAAILVALAIASDLLLGARQPWVTPGQSLVDLDAHGGVLVLRGFVSFLLAVLVGTIIGRTLPSVIVATVVVAAVGLTGVTLTSLWLKANVTYSTEQVDIISVPGGFSFGSMSRAKDGVVISDELAMSLAPPGVDPTTWVTEHYDNVFAVVPGTMYPRYVLLETGAIGVVLAILAIGLVVAVERRRPS